MTAPTRALHPDIRVTLHKLVKRTTVNGSIPAAERFQDAGRVFDLTPALGESGTVHTQKSVRAPAGAFSLTFADVPHKRPLLETLYGLIEPMDGIEIRMAHNTTAEAPPVVMRGFVSRIARSQSVDAQGAPIRTVTVDGQDYGKIWQMLLVLRRPWYALGQTWLSSFPLFERFGLGLATNIPGNQFIADVIEKVLNPHLDRMLPADWPMPRQFTPDCIVPDGLTSVTGPQNAEGSVYQIMALFADVIDGWNELYIEDRQDSVAVVYRPNPAIDLDGTPIQQTTQGAASPGMPVLPGADIAHLYLERSDANVANWFWVEDPRFELVRSFPLQQAALTSAQRETVFMETHPNNNPIIYGLRPMIAATQMGSSSTFQTGQTEPTQIAREQQNVRWLDQRRTILGRMNRDNCILETGSIRIAGNEDLRAGQHIVIGTGPLAAPYYIVSVAHDYVPFRGFFTSLTLERGQGFAKRVAAANLSPYLAEIGGQATPQPSAQQGSVGQTQGTGAPGGAAPSTTVSPFMA